jgi:hypothetical protein
MVISPVISYLQTYAIVNGLGPLPSPAWNLYGL